MYNHLRHNLSYYHNHGRDKIMYLITDPIYILVCSLFFDLYNNLMSIIGISLLFTIIIEIVSLCLITFRSKIYKKLVNL